MRSTTRNGRVPRQTMFSLPSGIRSSTWATTHAQPDGLSPSSLSQTIPSSDSAARHSSIIVL